MAKDLIDNKFQVKKLYSVFDVVSLAYGIPMMFNTVDEAKRSFGDIVRSPGSVLSQHPSDYWLYQIGTFDVLTGILSCDDFRLVCRASEFVNYTSLTTSEEKTEAEAGAVE